MVLPVTISRCASHQHIKSGASRFCSSGGFGLSWPRFVPLILKIHSSGCLMSINRRFCTAPMMEWSDRHCRYFWRLLTRRAVLYSEMVTTAALLHGNREQLLGFDPFERPLALQLGGNDPHALAQCARIAQEYGYDEINLNVGCPSDRVHAGQFGACLMARPETVAACVAAMRSACDLPVTVKTRIGIDAHDSYAYLHHFIETVAQGGCAVFIIHARKAWLNGLSPKENRSIPPLDYARVQQVKQDFPALEIILNGGIVSLEEGLAQLGRVDGVMVGREAYQNPYLLAAVDQRFYGDARPVPTRAEVMVAWMEYAQRQLERGVPLQAMTRHILGLFHAQPRGRLWRRHLSENAHRQGAGVAVVAQALALTRRPAPVDDGV